MKNTFVCTSYSFWRGNRYKLTDKTTKEDILYFLQNTDINFEIEMNQFVFFIALTGSKRNGKQGRLNFRSIPEFNFHSLLSNEAFPFWNHFYHRSFVMCPDSFVSSRSEICSLSVLTEMIYWLKIYNDSLLFI